MMTTIFAVLTLLADLIAAASLGGVATWYDAPSSRDAAAGPELRAMLGKGWRGDTVTVHGPAGSVVVRLTDWCACGDRRGQPTLIDLDDKAFARIAPNGLGDGVIAVTVTAGGAEPRQPAPTLPPTDTAP